MSGARSDADPGPGVADGIRIAPHRDLQVAIPPALGIRRPFGSQFCPEFQRESGDNCDLDGGNAAFSRRSATRRPDEGSGQRMP